MALDRDQTQVLEPVPSALEAATKRLGEGDQENRTRGLPQPETAPEPTAGERRRLNAALATGVSPFDPILTDSMCDDVEAMQRYEAEQRRLAIVRCQNQFDAERPQRLQRFAPVVRRGKR